MTDLTPYTQRVLEDLAKEIHELRRKLAKVQRSQDAGHTTIHRGAFQVVDEDENVTHRLGVKGLVPVAGPKPKTPAPPSVESGQASVNVITDGEDVDGNGPPEDWEKTLIYVSENPDPETVAGDFRGSLWDPEGEVTISVHAGLWYAWLVWVSASGRRSDPSDVVEVEVEPPVDTTDLEATLAEAEQIIADAVAVAQTQLDTLRDRLDNFEEYDPTDLIAQINQVTEDLAAARQEAAGLVSDLADQVDGIKIPDVSGFITQAEVDAAATAAETAAKEHADLVAQGAEDNAIAEAETKANAAQAAAEAAAKAYTDQQDIETLEAAAADATAKADAAQTAAEAEADRLAKAEAQAAQTEAIRQAKADALAQANAARDAAIESASTDATAKAEAAQAAAEAYAEAEAQAKADAAQAEAIRQAAEDATAKANKAREDAEAAANNYADRQDAQVKIDAALDAQEKADAAQSAAEAEADRLAKAEAQAAQTEAIRQSKADALAQAEAARDAAIASASTDAAAKADAAQAAAEQYAEAEAQAKADAAQAEAIHQAAEDATAKANAVREIADAAHAEAGTAWDQADAALNRAISAESNAIEEAGRLATAAREAAEAEADRLAKAEAQAAQTEAIRQAKADALAQAEAARDAAIESSSGDATAKADAAREAAEAYAEAEAQAKADAAQTEAIRQAAEDATAKANAAQTAAETNAITEAGRLADAARAVADEAKAENRIKDTRDDNEPPSYYYAMYPVARVIEFKRKGAIGLPAAASGSYAHLITHISWGDPSGGPIRQEALDAQNEVWTRVSLNRDDWGPWGNKLAEAEAAAKEHADNMPKMLGGTGGPVGTAPNGSIWFQRDSNNTVIGRWERIGGSWVQQEVSGEIIDNLEAGKITALHTEFAESVIGKLWTQLAIVDRLVATSAWIGGAMIGEDAVEAKHVVASETLSGKVAEFLKLNVTDLVATGAQVDDAVIRRLWTDGLVALSATLARATVASQNLIPGMSRIDEATPPPFKSGFGRNSGHPSIWVRSGDSEHGDNTVTTSGDDDALIHLEASEVYRFRVGVAASKSGTTAYMALADENGNRVTLTRNGSTSSYLLVNHEAGSAATRPEYYEAEITPPYSGAFRLIFYANHTNGAPNPGSYQWFHGLTFANMLDGSLVVEDTIRTRHLHVTREMVGEFAKFMHLVVDQMDVNRLWADQTWQNAGYFGAEGGGFRTTVNGQGVLTEQESDGEYLPASQLGGPEQALTFWDENQDPTATVERSGDASFQLVDAARFEHQGRPVFDPDCYTWHDGPILDSLPRGIVDQTPQFSMLGTTVAGRTAYGFLEVAGRVEAGRVYRVTHSPFHMDTDANYYAEYTHTFSSTDTPPPAPHTESTRLASVRWRNATSDGLVNGTGEVVFTATETGIMRILLVVGRASSGTGISFIQSGVTYARAQLTLEDIGPVRRWNGRRRYAAHGGSQNPDRDPVVLTQGYTTQWTPSWQQVYRGNVTSVHHSHGSSSAIQGRDGAGNFYSSLLGGYQTSSAVRGDHAGQTMEQALNGRTVISGRIIAVGTSQNQTGVTNFYWHAHGQAPSTVCNDTQPPNHVVTRRDRAGTVRVSQLPQTAIDAINAGTFQGFTIHPVHPTVGRDLRSYHGIGGATHKQPLTIELSYE